MRSVSRIILPCVIVFLLSVQLPGQTGNAARYEIDAKRIGVNPDDKDALPRSREFIRLDSTYYVGWLLEGLYKYERSGDYLGYHQAIVPLRKAFYLMEKDYGDKLKRLFSSFEFFQQNLQRFDDFYMIANTLIQSYNSIEMPDSTMALIDKIESYQFQRDFFGLDCDRCWLYHRNRFYTSDKHPFLKNSIEENVQMALKSCYRQIETIQRNKQVNDMWYGPYQSSEDLLTVYHYLAIMHNYMQRYDSAEYYYRFLIQGGRVSWSNYANMQHEVGLFSAAMENYQKPQYRRRFALEEASYYIPTLMVYAGNTKEAIRSTQEKIELVGSTPGFGWYNIALARAYLYDGQLDSSEFHLNKAFQFKELHINTTLTQSQYEFTINLLRVQLADKKISQLKFFDKGWWYSPSGLYNYLSLKLEKAALEYALVDALASNPERQRMVYDLFCAEATVSFDESTYLLKDFCLPFFKRKYGYYASTDPRLRVKRYFQLLQAKFTFEDGDEEEALQLGETLLQETLLKGNTSAVPAEDTGHGGMDRDYERLYAFRLMELLAHCTDDEEKQLALAKKCFEAYPQLLPYSEISCVMRLECNGQGEDPQMNQVIDDLKDCAINWTESEDSPKAKLYFEKKGDTYRVVLNVWNHVGKQIVTNSELLFKTTDGVGKELALRLFGKGGAVRFSELVSG